MAIYLNNAATVTVGGTAITDYVQSVTLNINYAELDVTALGDSGITRVAGLEDSSISLEFLNDTVVIDTLNSYKGSVKSVVITQAGNTYTADCLISQLTPVNGAVGDMSTQSVTWPVSGTVSITGS